MVDEMVDDMVNGETDIIFYILPSHNLPCHLIILLVGRNEMRMRRDGSGQVREMMVDIFQHLISQLTISSVLQSTIPCHDE